MAINEPFHRRVGRLANRMYAEGPARAMRIVRGLANYHNFRIGPQNPIPAWKRTSGLSAFSKKYPARSGAFTGIGAFLAGKYFPKRATFVKPPSNFNSFRRGHFGRGGIKLFRKRGRRRAFRKYRRS